MCTFNKEILNGKLHFRAVLDIYKKAVIRLDSVRDQGHCVIEKHKTFNHGNQHISGKCSPSILPEIIKNRCFLIFLGCKER